jgi:hypothetical protein
LRWHGAASCAARGVAVDLVRAAALELVLRWPRDLVAGAGLRARRDAATLARIAARLVGIATRLAVLLPTHTGRLAADLTLQAVEEWQCELACARHWPALSRKRRTPAPEVVLTQI